MCARRFLIAVFVLILLAVAAAFALFQWGGNVLLRQATPEGHFVAAEAGGAPDYRQLSSWLARPGIADDPSRWVPEQAPAQHSTAAAVLYIHPTSYLRGDRWNAPLQPDSDTAARTLLFVRSQASVFSPHAEVWAPRYRQAAFGAFLLDNNDARAALELAFRDVSAAFDEFLKQVPPNKPIILAGHSQGGRHLERLLRDKVAGSPVAKRIAAAYIVGWPVSTKVDLPALGLPACRTPDQARCILSWLTFADPANPDLILHSYDRSPGLLGGKREREDLLCVNPLTGSHNGSSDARANSGTLIPSADYQSARVEAFRVGARCDNGLLIIDGDIPAYGGFVMPGNNYHAFDYALFWGPISADAGRRIAGWGNSQ